MKTYKKSISINVYALQIVGVDLEALAPIHGRVLAPSDASLRSIWIHCFITLSFAVGVSLQAPACQWPICKRSILLTQSFCPGSFSVRRSAVIFSFERQSHWDSVCCFTRQWMPFKRNGLLLVCVSNSALCWETSWVLQSFLCGPSSSMHRYISSHPSKHAKIQRAFTKTLVVLY